MTIEAKPESVIWICDHCGYLVTDTVMTYARFDYYCPRCKEQKFSRFQPTLLSKQTVDKRC